MIVTHFSRGSFLSNHGLCTSPFFIRREWKNGVWCAWKPEVDAARDDGADGLGDEKGFGLGGASDEMLSVVSC